MRVGGGADDSVEKLLRFLRRVFAVALLARAGRLDVPERLHLSVAVLALHLLVVERVAALRVAPRPKNRLGRVREVAAGEVRRRVDLVPRDVVQNLEAERLHCEADAVDVVRRARHPDAPVRLEQASALAQPFTVKLMHGLERLGPVPHAFVDADHTSGVTRYAVVREEVGRVCEDEVEVLGLCALQKL